MKLRRLIYLIFILCTSNAFSQQRSKHVQVEIVDYEEEQIPSKFFNTSEYLYQLNVLSGNLKGLDFQLMFRVEDKLSSEETYALFSEVTFFDLEFSHRIGPIKVSWAIENLLNFNSPAFAIEGSLERNHGVIHTVSYRHEADFMTSTALTYNF